MTREGESGKRFHPTQKPVKLCVDVLEIWKANIILDVYLGSGTTLIACEQLGRKCRAIEISPAYVDVSVQRWADFTGQDPVRHDGVKWSEITKE
jgi:DNA modification methylase